MEQVLPKSQAEISVALQRLTRAGYRERVGREGLLWLQGSCSAGSVLDLPDQQSCEHEPVFCVRIGLGLGFLAPDFWLGRMIKTRQKKMQKGLPDVLDLLVICIEAGLSLDQATARTAEELKNAQPELCDEFGVLVLEQRAGRARADAWKHLAERTGVDSIKQPGFSACSVRAIWNQRCEDAAACMPTPCASRGFSKWRKWQQRPRSNWCFRWCFSSFPLCSWWFWDRR